MEHLLSPGSGTQTKCSCGAQFATTIEAQQHQWWHLQLVKSGPVEVITKYTKGIETLYSVDGGKTWLKKLSQNPPQTN